MGSPTTTSVSSKGAAVKKASGDFARKEIDKKFQGSSIPDKTGDFPKFHLKDLCLGKVLGKGGFGTVWELKAVDGKATKSSGNDDEVVEVESRQFIADHCIRKSGQCRYAVKQLSREVVKDTAMNIQGMIDMAAEVHFLSSLEHPMIVKLRALDVQDPYQEGFFIVMDRLFDTLDNRISKWKKQELACSGLRAKVSDRKGEKKAALYDARITVAYDMSSALAYLHSRNIIYRDVKGENAGFDIRGDIKIFDFGLAKELTEDLRNKDGTYNLTGMTGSLRFMAPEVANGQPYNDTCDVYSFSVLLWGMLKLKEPYEMYTPKSLREKVYNGAHKRPLLDETITSGMKLLLQRCWAKDIKERPRMEQVCEILKSECVRCRNGDDSGLEHNKRRSTFVFRPSAEAQQKRKEMLAALNKNSQKSVPLEERPTKGTLVDC